MKDFEMIEIFRAIVTKKEHQCVIAVQKYWADFKHNDIAIQFKELDSTFRKYEGEIKNFKTKLRISGYCQILFPVTEKDIVGWIEKKIKETYGQECNIKIAYAAK